MKLALVHSWLNQYGGAERVLEAVHALYPGAPVYTSMYDPPRMPPAYRQWDIRVSFLDLLPGIHAHHQRYLPLYPLGFEAFDLAGYQAVLSISSAFAHGVVPRPETFHLCYCLTPPRFLWNTKEYLNREAVPKGMRALLGPLLLYLRAWDRRAAARVDAFVAISTAVQRRVARVYGREAAIIHPPVAVEAFKPEPRQEREDFYLIVSRLVPYKRIDLAVAAFNELGWPLVIVGEGRDRPALEAQAKDNVRFLGRLADAEVRRLLPRARGFVFPGWEDFGITPVEANAAGVPVIAYRAGGVLDTVIEGETGVLFEPQTPEALAEAVRRAASARSWDAAVLRRQAARFSVGRFHAQLAEALEKGGQAWSSGNC